MNISLPDDMKDFIDRQVTERGYGTSNELLRDLIRREQDRQQLRRLLIEGAASHRTGEAGAPYSDSLRPREGCQALLGWICRNGWRGTTPGRAFTANL